MSNLTPMSDLAADDLLLDRLGARLDGGADPVADLLGALARQADGPLPARTARRRTTRNHRYLGVFMAIAVGASGAGVAAAVSLPHSAPARVERAHVIQPGEAPRPSRTQSANKAPDGVPGGPLSRLGLPVTMASAAAEGLVLVRRQDGTIVLVPGNAAAAAASAEELGAATGSSAAQPAADTHEDAKGASAENGEKGEGDQTAKAATSAKGGAPTKGTAAATGEKTGATAKAGATAKEPGSGKGSKATEGTNADPATSTRTPKTGTKTGTKTRARSGTKTGTKTRARSGTKTRATSGTKTGTVRPGTSGAPAAEVAPTP